MQELDYYICYNSLFGTTGQLRDTRDDKYYWVTKLPDGNCWMTQNLDYNDPGSERRTGATKPDTWSGTSSNYKVREYWDPGEKVAEAPVSGSDGKLIDATSSNSEQGHLLVGNYYSWASATNDTGTNLTSGDASGSICPAGWKLPTGNNTNNGSFAYLQTQGGIGATGSMLTSAPYYFPYSGLVYSGYLYDAGTRGYYWSSTAYNANNAYYLLFYASVVDPSNTTIYYSGRHVGVPVRCLVIGS